MIDYSTNHTLELIYFDSNKQKKNEQKVIASFIFYRLSAIAQRRPANSFDCYADVYMHFLRCWLEKTHTPV